VVAILESANIGLQRVTPTTVTILSSACKPGEPSAEAPLSGTDVLPGFSSVWAGPSRVLAQHLCRCRLMDPDQVDGPRAETAPSQIVLARPRLRET
jgi:hypothetical protein